jgi:diguanylate cyclase (GGDEF)-like protein
LSFHFAANKAGTLMIRVYTADATNAEAIRQAVATKGYAVEVFGSIDRAALSAALSDSSILVFDLTSPGIHADAVLAALDILEPERIPPILYLLADPGQIDLITQSVSLLNQDYAFTPLDLHQLSGRIEVLMLLGARRKLTMESAITDRLTGLYNRKYFLRRLEEEMYRSKRYDYVIGVHLVEVDFSAPGHQLTEQAGTVVMKEVGEFFKGRLRKSDQVSRFKWDSFAVLLPDIPAEDSLLVAKDVKQKLEALAVTADSLAIQLRVNIAHLLLPREGIGTAPDAVAALEDSLLIAKTLPEGVAVYGENS